MDKKVKKDIREAVIYSIWSTLDDVTSGRVLIQDFYASLNRRGLLGNAETAEEINKSLKHLEALEECASEEGRKYGLDECVQRKLKEKGVDIES